MEYLHACNLIHRDLKSVNLLVSEISILAAWARVLIEFTGWYRFERESVWLWIVPIDRPWTKYDRKRRVCWFNSAIRSVLLLTNVIRTVSWIAPEIFQQEHYTEKADVYSFGVVLWELWTRRIPFEDESTFEIPLSVIRVRWRVTFRPFNYQELY